MRTPLDIAGAAVGVVLGAVAAVRRAPQPAGTPRGHRPLLAVARRAEAAARPARALHPDPQRLRRRRAPGLLARHVDRPAGAGPHLRAGPGRPAAALLLLAALPSRRRAVPDRRAPACVLTAPA